MPRLLPGDVVEQHGRGESCIRIRRLSPAESRRSRDTFTADNLLEEPSHVVRVVLILNWEVPP
jgi:hypothetical protein